MPEYLDEDTKLKFIDAAKLAQNQDFSKIANFLKRRNIKRLFHFTHISNLESILINGLRTRQSLDFSKTKYQYSDLQRLDKFTESISFSIGEPNRLLLPLKNFDFEHQMLLLEVSANSLLTQNFAAFPSNVASGFYQSQIINNSERYTGIRSLEGLYLNSNLRKEAKLQLEVPTDSQSEVLFFEPIAPERIQKIHISPHFPLEMRPAIDKLKSSYSPDIFELACECRLFERWAGTFRSYNTEWESNG